MILVLININNNLIHLFTPAGIQNIPLNNYMMLDQLIGNQEVYYVNDFKQVNPFQIISFLKSTFGHNNSSNVAPQENYVSQHQYNQSDSNNLVVHSTRGMIIVNDLGQSDQQGNITGEVFKNIYDFKPLDYLKKMGWDQSSQVDLLINSGKLEIINKEQANQLIQQKNMFDIQKQSKMNQMQQSQYDFNTNQQGNYSYDIDYQVIPGQGGVGPQFTDGVIEIDLGKSGSGRSSSYGNEGQLVPSNFVN